MLDNELENKIAALERDLAELKRNYQLHRHADTDRSSSSFIGSTDIKASTITVYGGPIARSPGLSSVPLQIVDNTSQTSAAPNTRRAVGNAIAIVGRDTTGEQINGAMIVGTLGANETSLANSNQTEFLITHSVGTLDSFVQAIRTPLAISAAGDGFITSGTSTLNSAVGGFIPNAFVGAILYILSADQSTYYNSFTILGNSNNQITFDGTFSQPTGSYTFSVKQPVYLGAADAPWRRLYVLEGTGGGIRIGNGPTAGGQNGLLYMDSVGDLYWRNKGGTSTKLN